MREIRYIKKSPTGCEYDDIDSFFCEAHDQFINAGGVDGNVFALEMQPGDGTRYHLYVIRASGGHLGVVAMDVPRFMVVQVNLDDPGDLVFPHDNPLSLMSSEYTAAIFADVVSAVLRGSRERFYDYEYKRPGPKEVTDFLRKNEDAAAPAVDLAPETPPVPSGGEAAGA